MQLFESYAITLHAFVQLEDERRLERLLEEGERISNGGLMAIAFNEPKKLADVERRYRAKVQGRMPKEDLMRLAAGLLQREAEGLARLKKKAKKRGR